MLALTGAVATLAGLTDRAGIVVVAIVDPERQPDKDAIAITANTNSMKY